MSKSGCWAGVEPEEPTESSASAVLVQQLEARVTALEGEYTNVKALSIALQAERTTSEAHIATLEAENTKLEARFTALEAQYADEKLPIERLAQCFMQYENHDDGVEKDDLEEPVIEADE